MGVQKIIGSDIERGIPYPPYHTGPTFEEYACEYFKNKENFYPVYWTRILNCSNAGSKIQAVQELTSLPDRENGFTISTHDDAPLPFKKTKNFSAGGNMAGIPIPLIGSKPPYEATKKTILIQFHGSITHSIRKPIEDLTGIKDFNIKIKNWTSKICKADEENNFSEMAKAKFILCPRGYGPTSFRLYEALHLKSIPIYISNNFYLPFTDKINWEKIAILAHTVDEGIRMAYKLTEAEISEMLEYTQEKLALLTDFKTICNEIDGLT